jgi:hypothetical protein
MKYINPLISLLLLFAYTSTLFASVIPSRQGMEQPKEGPVHYHSSVPFIYKISSKYHKNFGREVPRCDSPAQNRVKMNQQCPDIRTLLARCNIRVSYLKISLVITETFGYFGRISIHHMSEIC